MRRYMERKEKLPLYGLGASVRNDTHALSVQGQVNVSPSLIAHIHLTLTLTLTLTGERVSLAHCTHTPNPNPNSTPTPDRCNG